MSTHTPGPWIVGQNQAMHSENFLHPAIGAEGRELAIAVIPVIDDEADANARLISAAPELLEACKAVLREHVEIQWIPEVYDMLTAAIAKATGESN